MMTTTSANRFAIRIDTKLLVERLAQVLAGGLISYEELGGVIGRRAEDIMSPGSCYRCLESARRIVLRDYQFVFRAVPRQGLRRLTDSEIVSEVPEEARKTIRRKVGKAGREIIAVDFAKLDNAEKVKHNASLSILGAIGQALTPAKTKKIEAACKKAHTQLSLAQTLEVFQE